VHSALVLVQIGFTVVAMMQPFLKRLVQGALPDLIRDLLGIDFTAEYTMVQMGLMAAQAGGLDVFMAANFLVFTCIGPLLRPISVLLLMHLPLTSAEQRRLHVVSRHLAAYHAFEVLLLAAPLVGMGMGPISKVLLGPTSFPPCAPLSAMYPEESSCFMINVEVLPAYFAALAPAVAICFISGFDGTPTHKFLHCKVYPDDWPPPYAPRLWPRLR